MDFNEFNTVLLENHSLRFTTMQSPERAFESLAFARMPHAPARGASLGRHQAVFP